MPPPTASGDLNPERPDDLLTFDLRGGAELSAVARTTLLPILARLRLFVVELWAAKTHPTDDVTSLPFDH